METSEIIFSVYNQLQSFGGDCLGFSAWSQQIDFEVKQKQGGDLIS